MFLKLYFNVPTRTSGSSSNYAPSYIALPVRTDHWCTCTHWEMWGYFSATYGFNFRSSFNYLPAVSRPQWALSCVYAMKKTVYVEEIEIPPVHLWFHFHCIRPPLPCEYAWNFIFSRVAIERHMSRMVKHQSLWYIVKCKRQNDNYKTNKRNPYVSPLHFVLFVVNQMAIVAIVAFCNWQT